jgi:hypothetical protein
MKDYRKIILAFYRYTNGKPAARIEEIPPDVLQFLAGMEYTDMLRPIVVQSLRAGSPVKSLAEYWGVDPNYVRKIRERYKIQVYNKSPAPN